MSMSNRQILRESMVVKLAREFVLMVVNSFMKLTPSRPTCRRVLLKVKINGRQNVLLAFKLLRRFQRVPWFLTLIVRRLFIII